MNLILFIYLGVVYVGCLAYCCRDSESDVSPESTISPIIQTTFKPETIVRFIQPGKECIICLEEYGDKEIIFLECCHSFHKTCIQQWMLKKKECPICSHTIL